MTETTVDDLLALVYAQDLKGKKDAAITSLKDTLAGDTDLMSQAQARQIELNALIKVRGLGACSYSTKYRAYLNEALT